MISQLALIVLSAPGFICPEGLLCQRETFLSFLVSPTSAHVQLSFLLLALTCGMLLVMALGLKGAQVDSGRAKLTIRTGRQKN